MFRSPTARMWMVVMGFLLRRPGVVSWVASVVAGAVVAVVAVVAAVASDGATVSFSPVASFPMVMPQPMSTSRATPVSSSVRVFRLR